MNSYDKKFLKVAMPAAWEGLFMVLLASADLIMVGALGTLSVAAVSIFLQPRLILLAFSRSLASTVTLLVSKNAGRGNKETVADIMKKSLTLCAVFMAILHFLFGIFLKDIYILLGANDDYMKEALLYGSVTLISVYFTSLALILQAVQLGYGRTAAIMKTNILGNIINVILNAVLIFGIGPIPAMGITGAAVGTVCAALFTLIWTFFLLRKENFFTGGSYFPDRAYYKTALPIFAGILSEQGSERIGMVLFGRMAAGLGTVPFAVHSICMNICDIYYDFMTGFGKASMVMAGQSCGKKSPEDWNAYRKSGIKLSVLLSCLACAATVFFRKEIFGLYSADTASVEMASVIMIFVAVVSFPEAHALLLSGILRGSGKTSQVAAYSFVSITFLRPLITAILLYELDMGLYGCWCALLLDQTIRAACASVLVRRLQSDMRLNPASDAASDFSRQKSH